jgi:hypothetical protein
MRRIANLLSHGLGESSASHGKPVSSAELTRVLTEQATTSDDLGKALDGIRQGLRAAAAASAREVRSGGQLALELRHFTEMAGQLDELLDEAGADERRNETRTP